MNQEHIVDDERRMHQAVAELQGLISGQYPTASFMVGPGGENPEGTYLTVAVDLDDPDEVLDLVIDRVLDLQLEDGLPVHVIPTRTPERVAEVARKRPRLLAPSGSER